MGGLMGYELAINPRPLPTAGEEWQALRDGSLDDALLEHLSDNLRALLKNLIRPCAHERPGCDEILRRSCVAPPGSLPVEVSVDDEVRRLRRELEAAQQAAEGYRHAAEKRLEEVHHLQSLLREREFEPESKSL